MTKIIDKSHWLYKGKEQLADIQRLERQGLGAIRIRKELVKLFGKEALSLGTVKVRLQEIRYWRSRWEEKRSEIYNGHLKEFFKENPDAKNLVSPEFLKRYVQE